MSTRLAALERAARSVLPIALGLGPAEADFIMAGCRHLLFQIGNIGRRSASGEN
ncbi:hypothetical protein [Allosphingosinicella deserti]|uniref:hypothetical protein n=1 Tax=Allosphingosinicella deserti TaxID=2116704 RepID=UPI001304B27B|nr:hypothetical protein [Sphingomonas deserti]